ncbi:hypothetical protein F5880DRAFT_1606910 [Lentinula raphanica]|nr:hypothetical protein F5880DRAFT_1606910 [Lentinula raphanica]
MQANESLLEAALTESFTPPPSRRQSKIAPPSTSSPAKSNPDPTPAEAFGESDAATTDDAWKNEYEEQVKTWRMQSAEAREKAERERAKWEALREAEKTTGTSPPPPPSYEFMSSKPLASGSPSPADARDLVTGETPRATSHSRQLTGEDSQKWEHLPSEITSSLPSMSFPEDSGHEETKATPPPREPPAAPASATLSVFDTSLSTSTRVKAFASALAINLLLPFVNGVMLGFGEIFAKNVVLGWFGWKTNTPGSTAASLGLRKTRR